MGGFRGVTLLMSVSLLGVACGGPEPVPPAELTWEEFQARAYKEPGTDVYIIEGDMAFEGTEGLRHYFDAYVAQQPGQRQDGLTLNASGAKWAGTQRALR